MIAVTNKEDFNENDSYVVAVPKNKVALKQHIAYNYPHWKLVDCDSIEDGAKMVDDGKVDCFIMGSSQVLSFDSKKNFKIIPLTKTMEACFAVKDGQATLLSILNKTIKAMPSDMLTSAIAMYDSTAYKTTFYSFLKDHLVIVLVLGFSIIIVILLLLQKARRAEASAKVALKSAEDASLAKTQFLHNVSHDIRTPMNAILGYSELMDNELKDNDLPRVFEHLNKLQKAGNILLSIINNVLDMARIESGKMELDENYEVVGNITQLVCSAFAVEASRKNIEFNIIVNVEHKHIIVDSTKMQEILSNLISNAIKYTSAGGKVTIDTKELPYDKEGYVLIQTKVSDTGIGMSEDFLPSLFELFTRERNTTLSKIPGTGLGMAIVKNFVDLMNGSIEVESELGKGSTFTITIPHKIANKDYTNRNIESSNEFDIDFMGKRILLAEDNELNAEITTTILSEMGFEVKAVEDGILCVNEIQHQPANTYDLILMDIQMPNMDGYKATHCIRRLSQPEKANIPIIAMSANAFEEDKKKAFDVKMNDYITKPIDFQKMEQVLKHILSK